jgi:hypothetical protein
LFYVLSTPEWVRAYDWEGHHEYVLHVLSAWTIPPATLGWETYQPPLFYFLAAAVKSALSVFGYTEYEALQILPLWISCAVLFTGWHISRLLWKEGDAKQFLFLLLLAVFPGLVFQASQITNDGLFLLLGTVWMFFLLKFQTTRTVKNWLLASLIVTLAMLTKSNALLLLAAQGASLLFMRMDFRRKATLAAVLAAIVGLGSGWLLFLRFVVENQTSIIGNIDQLPAILHIPTSTREMLSFNPLQLITIPFVNDVGDWSRRSYFFEYVMKSALFGSHTFSQLLDISRLLMVSALTLIGFSIAGCLRSLKTERTRLFLVVIAAFMGGVFCYRLIYTISSNQHFRFVAPIVLPIAAFAVSYRSKRFPWLINVLECTVVAFAGLSLLFFVALSVMS